MEAFATEKIDWGHAETLAFATIIQDGNPIRFTGQDAQRGTFSQRHLVLHDKNNGDNLRHYTIFQVQKLHLQYTTHHLLKRCCRL